MRSIILTLLILNSCTPSAPKTTSSASKGTNATGTKAQVNAADTSNNPQTSQSTDSSSTPTTPPPAPVDASKLTVSGISIGKLSTGGSSSDVVNFFASGQTTYVLWQLCPEDPTVNTGTCVATDSQACGLGGACVQNVTPYNKIIFPKLFAGRVTFSIKACVDPSNALDPNTPCGPFTDLEYDSKVSNTQVTTLFAQRQSIIDALTTLGDQMKQIYVNYQGDLTQCMQYDQQNAAFYQSKIAVIHGLIDGVFWKMFTWGPDTLINEMNQSSAGAAILGAVKGAVNGVENAISSATNKFCSIGTTTGTDTSCLETLQNNTSTMTKTQQDAMCQSQTATPGAVGKVCAIVGSVLKAMGGMASSMNPAESIVTLSNAIHDVSNPDATVSITCHAEQTLAKSLQAANESAAGLTQQLLKCDNALRALGEL